MTPAEMQQLALIVNPDGPWSLGFWIKIGGFVIAGAGLLFAGWQIRRLSQQLAQSNEVFKADHDRTRRENLVNTLRHYTAGTKPEHNKMVQLLDRMSEDQLINLWEAKPITLGGELKEFACSALRREFPDAYERHCKDREPVQFTHGESMQLRYIMLDVLNDYEVCLAPWHLGIADEEAMESQFKALVDRKDGKHKLDAARNIIGPDRFPASKAFKDKLFPPEGKIQPAKPQLGQGQ
ncbi:hypothetical protein [Jannaschia rubra]|uniref:hypothetical protein n=1 Tax=Jannaschia rubra TaxID=282197 RepID=UPI0024912512|nr:hypothetical protein [Jannaschia rubra]